MKKETRHTVRAGVKIGALAGGIAFIVLGLVPAFYLSSFGTVAVMSAIAGGPIAPGLLARATIVIGTVLGICAAGAVSVCAGAAAGSALGYVADALTPAKEAEEVKS
jgi:hypothetical protein